MRALLPLLGGISIVLSGCLGGQGELDIATPLSALRKEVVWVNSTNRIKYAVELTAQGNQVYVHLSLLNIAGEPIYLLADPPWEIWNDQRMVRARWGDSTFMFGVELPQMRRIDAGEHIEESASLRLPIDWSDINEIRIGFFCLCDDAGDLGRELESLPAVSGWWQTHDTELAESFLNHLILEEVVFYRTPMKAGAVQERSNNTE